MIDIFTLFTQILALMVEVSTLQKLSQVLRLLQGLVGLDSYLPPLEFLREDRLLFGVWGIVSLAYELN